MKIKESNYLQELNRHNENAISFVITNYGGLVMSIIRKHLYYMEDKHEECFDDVFLNVWYHIESFDETKTSFKNWIAGIARYRSIDYLRKYRHELEELNWEDTTQAKEDDGLLELIENEISEETDQMLRCLSKEDRELFWKLYVDELPTELVSQETGIGRSALYKRVSRGKKKIRESYM